MSIKKEQKKKGFYSRATRALAIPVTFLMLFVSLSLLISLTYYVAVAKIASKGAVLNVSAAKQAMFAIDDSINQVVWSPGATKIYSFDDFGGKFLVDSDAKRLTIKITDNLNFLETIFNDTIGKASYELPSSEQSYVGLFLRGDTRVIIDQNGATTTQMCIEGGTDHALLALGYRPSASITVTDPDSAKPVNSLRIYIISLNKSQTIMETADFYLKIACLNTISTTETYDFNYALTSITVNVNLDGVDGTLLLPVLSNQNGAVLNVEVIVCNVQLEIV